MFMTQIESPDEEIEIKCAQKIASVFSGYRVCIVLSDAAEIVDKKSRSSFACEFVTAPHPPPSFLRKQGPITTGRFRRARWAFQRAQQLNPVVVGPGSALACPGRQFLCGQIFQQ